MVWLDYIAQAREYWTYVGAFIAFLGTLKFVVPLLASKMRADLCEQREKLLKHHLEALNKDLQRLEDSSAE